MLAPMAVAPSEPNTMTVEAKQEYEIDEDIDDYEDDEFGEGNS